MKNKIIAIAQNEVGKYKEGPNNDNPYGRDFDTKFWQFFNGKKSNVAYCAIFICWLIVTYFDGDLYKAQKFIGCPVNPANNCAAGVKYLHQYLKKTGTTISINDGQVGDIIFFRNDGHVGLIEKVANGYYHTIEGNRGGKTSDCVARGKYKIGSSNVTGIVRPAYTADVKPEPTKPTTKYEYPQIPARGYFKSGDKGVEVQKMQKILITICPGTLPRYGVDGEVGSETMDAVYQVQSKLGIARDHLYGPKTNAACKRYLEGV